MQKDMGHKISSEFTYINTAEGLSRLTEVLHGVVRIGLDTEADSLHHYFEKVCLIQLSFSGASYIVDPLAGFSLSEFLAVLSKKELIFQGADYDLRMLKKSFDFRPEALVFDTMLAAQVLGYEKIGLAALAERFCGVVLPKSGQKADWAKRPLSEKLLHYAADDTRYLERIAGELTLNLRELGREEWHRQCCERAVEISGRPDKSDSKEEWRIKGTSKLPPEALIFVRELWKWRDAEARRRDRPPFMILRNEDMIELAGWLAGNPVAPIERGPSCLKRIAGENLTRLEEAILCAKNCPAGDIQVPRRITMRESAVSLEKVEALRSACKEIADALRIEPCFLASRAAVMDIVRHRPASIEDVVKVSGMMRWQAELIMPAIKTVLGHTPDV